MFGFGMSAKDKWHLEQTEEMLAPLAAVAGAEVKPLARQLFDDTKAEVTKQYGDNMYLETFGDQFVKKEAFITKRLAAGLTVDDVRQHRNQTLFLQMLHAKVLEMTAFVAIDAARQQGKDILEVARQRRRTGPQYGEPEAWDASLPVNSVFTEADADIYIEFLARVGRWQEKTPPAAQTDLLSKYTSFNAMVRDLVGQGKL